MVCTQVLTELLEPQAEIKLMPCDNLITFLSTGNTPVTLKPLVIFDKVMNVNHA